MLALGQLFQIVCGEGHNSATLRNCVIGGINNRAIHLNFLELGKLTGCPDGQGFVLFYVHNAVCAVQNLVCYILYFLTIGNPFLHTAILETVAFGQPLSPEPSRIVRSRIGSIERTIVNTGSLTEEFNGLQIIAAFENGIIDERTTGELSIGQAGLSEHKGLDFSHAGRDGDGFQALAAVERAVVEKRHAIRNLHSRQADAVLEGMPTNRSHTFMKRHTGDGLVFSEGGAADSLHILRNDRHLVSTLIGHQNVIHHDVPVLIRGQRSRASECACCHIIDMTGAIEGSQSRTAGEGLGADLCDGIRQGHAGQIVALVKSTVADSGYTGLYHNRGDAILVFPPRNPETIIVHLTLAGNGQHAVGGQLPCQVIAAGAAGGDRCIRRKRCHRQAHQCQYQHQQNAHHFSI